MAVQLCHQESSQTSLEAPLVKSRDNRSLLEVDLHPASTHENNQDITDN